VNPTLLSLLLKHIEHDNNMTYYVINNRGDLQTNTHSDGPNAVTWGVFPGKEIIQPTIVEAVSFMAWKVCPSIVFRETPLNNLLHHRMRLSNLGSNGRNCTSRTRHREN
jgi:hypothetical protein